jgi:hypothetical protein
MKTKILSFILVIYANIGFSSIGDDPVKCFYKYGEHEDDNYTKNGFRKIKYKNDSEIVSVLFMNNKAEEVLYELKNISREPIEGEINKYLIENKLIFNKEKNKYIKQGYSYYCEKNMISIWNNKFGKSLNSASKPSFSPTPVPTPSEGPEPPDSILEKRDRHRMLLFLREQGIISSIRKNEDIPDKELIYLYNEAKKTKAIKESKANIID